MKSASLSRRGALLGAACLVCCGGAHGATPPAPTCTDVTAAPVLKLSPAEAERHTIFLLLAMALVYDGWGVDRARPDLVAAYAAAEPQRRFPDYAGHNIGAVLVDRGFQVVSFALNRNVALNSTLEHAEERAIRNAIRIANDSAGPAGPKPWSFGSLLREDRIYTTLEPCAQCAGIMDLANIRAVIYGQDDPSQRHLVDVIYNLQQRPGSPGAPLPIRASFSPYWDRLASGFERFQAQPSAGLPAGATSFLETVEAYKIYREAAQKFDAWETSDPENVAALRGAREFRARWQPSVADGVAPT